MLVMLCVAKSCDRVIMGHSVNTERDLLLSYSCTCSHTVYHLFSSGLGCIPSIGVQYESMSQKLHCKHDANHHTYSKMAAVHACQNCISCSACCLLVSLLCIQCKHVNAPKFPHAIGKRLVKCMQYACYCDDACVLNWVLTNCQVGYHLTVHS